ncbi:GTA-gp10 family protein [Kordiimonas laminariae]|uniref:GTA-gp10 family protein n=1 Tax=Kordiimonas laminariae TaxID=2917717 RepID=UPI001FF43646|nr:GTA-gp10 family protein [Kordiimonas laminariae]MCK0068033.1 gene transfer agent family protein [Kordiimonas laminariae]
MARKIFGEASLKVGARKVRLRLGIGTMMDLEDHFGMGLVPFLSGRFPEFRLKDMAVLYLAMTKGDFSDAEACRKAAETIVKTGLAEVATAISNCLEQTLNPDVAAESTEGAKPGK